MRPIGFKNLNSKNLPYDAYVEYIIPTSEGGYDFKDAISHEEELEVAA